MFYSHNNQLPHVKTAQVESVYGLIKAGGRMDLLRECLGSFCYTHPNPYRYIWHPAEEELTRKWAAADRNRSALWPTSCSLCMVPAPSRCQASGKTPFRAMRHRRGWVSKDLLCALESRNMNNVSGLFLLFFLFFEKADIQFYGEKKKKDKLCFFVVVAFVTTDTAPREMRKYFFCN